MELLSDLADGLSRKQQAQSDILDSAKNKTRAFMEQLNAVSQSIETFHKPIFESKLDWWPYVACPAATLVLGSYGLAPSAVRNLALVGVGKSQNFEIILEACADCQAKLLESYSRRPERTWPVSFGRGSISGRLLLADRLMRVVILPFLESKWVKKMKWELNERRRGNALWAGVTHTRVGCWAPLVMGYGIWE